MRRTEAGGPTLLARFVVVLCLAGAVAGCGYFRRVGECRKLAAHVNTALDGIQEARDAGGESAEAYRDIADRYERLSKEVAAFAGGKEPLDRSIQEYSVVFSDAARATRNLSKALEARNAAEAARIRRDLGLVSRREKTLVARIEGTCGSP
jgi:hypothetical protein